MDSRVRLAVIAAVVAVGVVVAVALTGSREPSQHTSLPASSKSPQLPSRCLALPSPAPTPAWYPADLPMPPGSYVVDVPAAQAGLRRVLFAAKGSLRDFVRWALTEWPKQGWRLGRGESEPGEAEDNFIKGRDRYGAFTAQTVYCDAARTRVLIVLAEPTPSPTPSP